MERLSDRLTLWLLQSIATAMLFFGVSMLMVGVPALVMLTGSGVTRTIAGIFLQIGSVFIVAGAAAKYLSRPRGVVLPNERAATPAVGRAALGGWLIALAIALVALPVWLVIRLQPFLVEWRRVVDYLATWDIWRGADASGSGVVLLPLAGALTPPMLELAALLAFVVASALLLPLLLSRSRRFPRIYLGCSVLLSALVIASVRGADAVMLAGEAVQQLIEDSSASAEEDAQLTQGLARYTSIVGSTAPVLAWTLCGYLGWVPAMIFSRRARTTFANSLDGRDSTSTGAVDIETITSPPRFPG